MTRADALRNRSQALESARAVLAERGLDAPLDEIARRAGIGNATLYRHFPARCDLVLAVFGDAMAEITAVTERALTEPDPWRALVDCLTFVCDLCARDRALADLMTTDALRTPELDRLRTEPAANLRRLLRRAKRHGVLRTDVRGEDMSLILKANAGLVERTRDQPDAWRRHLGYVIDGLRARGPAQARSDSTSPSSAPSARSTEHETHVNVGVSRLV